MSVYAEYSDKDLLTFLAESDESAFKEIYDRYWKRMYAMAFIRLQRTDIAEDIVQDIFCLLWEKRTQLSIRDLEPWLATAVKYKIISLVNRRLKKELLAEELPEIHYTDISIDQHFIELQLQQEINRLPEKCKLVFRFSREDEMTNKEIASELNISEKTVEKHITRARKELAITLRNLLHSLFSFLF